MAIEVKVPVLPESVSDATIATWHKKAGDAVKRDENLLDLETDKVVLEVPSPVDGVLKEIKFEAGDTVTSQQVIAMIEEGAVAAAAPAAAPPLREAPKAAAPAAAAPAKAAPHRPPPPPTLPPGARFAAATSGVNPAEVAGTGRRGTVTKEDIVNYASGKTAGVGWRRASGRARADDPHARPHRRAPDAVEELHRDADLVQRGQPRQGHGDAQGAAGRRSSEGARHQARLHELLRQGRRQRAAEATRSSTPRSTATTSSTTATPTSRSRCPPTRAWSRRCCATSSGMGFAEVEQGIADYAKKARDGKLGLDDLQGGTFTITNGGTFGSLMSTPIVNPPQSAILGMHAIKERAIVENGQVDRRADDVHRAVLRPPHHRRQGRGAVPGRHQEPAREPAPHAAGHVIPATGTGNGSRPVSGYRRPGACPRYQVQE